MNNKDKNNIKKHGNNNNFNNNDNEDNFHLMTGDKKNEYSYQCGQNMLLSA